MQLEDKDHNYACHQFKFTDIYKQTFHTEYCRSGNNSLNRELIRRHDEDPDPKELFTHIYPHKSCVGSKESRWISTRYDSI